MTDRVLTAIEADYRDMVAHAKLVSEQRMKDARVKLEADRCAWERAKRDFAAVEKDCSATYKASLAVADHWRVQATRRLSEGKPRVCGISRKRHVTTRERAPVSLPRVSILESEDRA